MSTPQHRPSLLPAALLAAALLALAVTPASPRRAAAGSPPAGGRAGGAPGAGEEEGEDASSPPDGEGRTAGKKAAPRPSPNLDIPHDLPERVQKEMEEAIGTWNSAVKAETGRKLLLSKAIDRLRAVSSKAPRSALPLYYLGMAYQAKHNFPEARRVLEKALKLSPRFHEAMVELADVHGWQKDQAGALVLYEKALEIDSSYAPALLNKSYAFMRLGRFKEAKAYLDRAMAIESDKEKKSLAKRLDAMIDGPGWPATYRKETDTYEVYSPVSQDYADEIARNAELIHRAYEKVFPDMRKPERKYPVWVYPDSASYFKAGHPPNTGGYYMPLFRNLVLWRSPRPAETLLTLYHEAFHQFLDDYIPMPPSGSTRASPITSAPSSTRRAAPTRRW